MKKKIIIPLVGIITIGFSFTVQAVTTGNANTNDTNAYQSDAYNTKAFFDKEKELNQGKDIIIHP